MKKLFTILTITILLNGCSLQPPFGGGDLTLADKYNQSQIKTKYQLEGAKLKRAVKDNPKDMVRVEIGEQLLGGDGDADIEPKLTISRWDEVSFSIKPKNYDKVTLKDKAVKFEGDKTVFETPKENYQLYEMPISEENPEGAFEYQIDLKEKPASNKIEFTLETQGLDFFYQPELTQKEIDEGASQPENVIGSYAVYASEQKTNWTGGKEYKVGKIGHIYRPKIIDSAGTEVWGDLHIENGILSVTIPQDFLDKAVYPVRHAAGLTFGYTTLGGTDGVAIAVSSNDGSATNGYARSTTEAGEIVSITVGLRSSVSTQAVDTFVALYEEDSNGADSHNLRSSGEELNKSLTTTATAYTINVSAYTLAVDAYILAVICNGQDIADTSNIFLRTDSGGASHHAYNEFTVGAGSYATRKAENPWGITDVNGTTLRSIYATYTTGGGGATPTTPNNDIILFE